MSVLVEFRVNKYVPTLEEVSSVVVELGIQLMAVDVMVSEHIITCIGNEVIVLDINECNNSPSPCMEVCTNNDGSYTCSCNESTRTVTVDGDCVGNTALLLCAVQ